jgi:dTMP kinase
MIRPLRRTTSLGHAGELLLNWRQRNDRGLLVVFEGLDGAGKTTMLQHVHDELDSLRIAVVNTRQPTNKYRDDPTVRKFLASSGTLAEACVVASRAAEDRSDHVATFILPQLEAGKVVLCDRYVFSFLAMFEFRGIERPRLIQMASNLPKPDISFFLDVPPLLLTERLSARPTHAVTFEERRPVGFAAARACYMHYRSYFHMLDGTLPAPVIAQRAVSEIRAQLDGRIQ